MRETDMRLLHDSAAATGNSRAKVFIYKGLSALRLHDGTTTSAGTRGEVFVDDGLNTLGLHDGATTAGCSRKEVLVDGSGKSVWSHLMPRIFVKKIVKTTGVVSLHIERESNGLYSFGFIESLKFDRPQLPITCPLWSIL